jgi:DnaJ like chaperone protein
VRRDPDLGSDDPYAVLGVRSNASWQEIVAAHRSLARRFHPDKVATLDQVARMAAEQIMFKINDAYRELKVRRGR